MKEAAKAVTDTTATFANAFFKLQRAVPTARSRLLVMDSPPQHFDTLLGLYEAGAPQRRPCRGALAANTSHANELAHGPANFRNIAKARGVARALAELDGNASTPAEHGVAFVRGWATLAQLDGADAHWHHDSPGGGDVTDKQKLDARSVDCTHDSPSTLLYRMQSLVAAVLQVPPPVVAQRRVQPPTPKSPSTTQFEQIHKLLHSSHQNQCTKTHVLKGENAKEPDVHICLDAIPDSGCVVYSIGIANNWIFDDFMIEQGCQVFSFDPSMTGVKKHKRHANHLFEPIGIGTIDGVHTGESTLNNKKTNYPVETLGHIMERHGHSHLTMVRMDVQGAEWDVLEQWLSKGWIEQIDQLLLEIHMRDPKDQERYSRLLHVLPLELFHTARNKWNGVLLTGDMTQVHEMGWLKKVRVAVRSAG